MNAFWHFVPCILKPSYPDNFQEFIENIYLLIGKWRDNKDFLFDNDYIVFVRNVDQEKPSDQNIL